MNKNKNRFTPIPFLCFWIGIILIGISYWVDNGKPYNKTGWLLIIVSLVIATGNILIERSKKK